MELVAKPQLLIFVVLYCLVLIGIGIYYSKQAKTSDDFVLAGKGLGSIVLIGTFLATYTGNGTISGGGNSLAYNYGLWPGFCFAIPAMLGIAGLFLLSGKIRESGCYTVAQLLEKKYGKGARTVGGIIIVMAMIAICSYQYKGLAYVLYVTTGLSTDIGTAIAAVIIILLAFSGGLKSVAVTDAVSAAIMLVGILIAVPFILNAAGGWSNVIASASEESLTFTGGQTAYGFLAAYFPLFFLTLADQNLYQRIAAGKGNKEVKIGMIGWFIGIIIIMPLVVVIAFCAKTIFGTNIEAGMAFMSTTTVVPVVVGGLLLAASTAFIITTGDSYLLSASTNITYDIYAETVNPKATDAQKFKMTRISIAVLGLFAYIMMTRFPSVLAIQYWAYTIYGAGITPAVIAALCWKKVTKLGGLTSMIGGALTTIVWEMLGLPGGIASVLVAVPVAIVLIIVVSLITYKGEEA